MIEENNQAILCMLGVIYFEKLKYDVSIFFGHINVQHAHRIRTTSIRQLKKMNYYNDYTRLIKEQKKQEARANEKVVTADLESVLLAPHWPCSSFYYSQRLQNLTVTEIDSTNAYAYI